MENESRKRLREEEAWSEARTSSWNPPPHAQPQLSLFTSEFTEAFENSNARPQKRLREDATRISEQAIDPPLQEIYTCATNDTSSYHSQILPSQANTFQRWNGGPGDYGTYDYSQGLASAGSGTTVEAPHHHVPYNPGIISTSCDRRSYGQDRMMMMDDTFIPPGVAQNMALALQGAHNFTVRDNAHIMSVGTISSVNHYGQLFGLDIMERFMEKYVSLNATHDSPVQDPDRICHPETRRNVLKRIGDWADNTDGSESIFWLHGPAGAGKSAIAQTIARSYSRQKVAATFFFFRSDPGRNDGNKLFTTIAWQLALLIPAIKIHLINSLNDRPDLPRKDVETQFQELIVKPLQALNSASSQIQLSGSVIIIDGVDECVDEKLQRRFLKIIGNAVNNPDFPLRFLICSRPEAHIEEAVDSFQYPPLRLDLAKLNADHEIEKYLRAEFSRIASKQDLDPTWPDDERIQKCVYKSSGHFVYASTVIKIVDDEYNSATTQLDIVLGLEPHGGKSLFAELDGLYTEILKRQPDWGFLYEILSLQCQVLSALITFPKEYVILMNTPETELFRKLRGMRSLLRLDFPRIAVYHKSFLDFLEDSSRSGQYHISEQAAERRFFDLITASIVRHFPIEFENPDCHEHHFSLSHFLIRPSLLSVEELQDVLQPLVHLQGKLLSMELSSWHRLLRCDECNIVHLIRDLLLYLACNRETSKAIHSGQVAEQGIIEPEGTLGSPIPFAATEVEQTVPEMSDLDACLSSLLVHLRKTKLEFPPSAMIINLTCSLLSFDHVEAAMRVRSISDGQLLVDIIDYMINNEGSLRRHNTAIARRAARFALEIHTRVPVLPRSLFCPVDSSQFQLLDQYLWTVQPLFMGRILDRNYVLRLSLMSKEGEFELVCDTLDAYESIKQWRQSNPDLVMMLRVMLEVAQVIQYVDSMDILLSSSFDLDAIFFDWKRHVKIFPLGSVLQLTRLTSEEVHQRNTFILGCTFYELYFDDELPRGEYKFKDDTIQGPERPSESEIKEDLWQIIQRCYAPDPKSRPTIDEVMQEMESWKLD